MRIASPFVWPSETIGVAPPVDSIRIDAKIRPVVIDTDAIFEIGMLSCAPPMKRGLMRDTPVRRDLDAGREDQVPRGEPAGGEDARGLHRARVYRYRSTKPTSTTK
jgi:hypothetical protein